VRRGWLTCPHAGDSKRVETVRGQNGRQRNLAFCL
jgi:hypothetical protein